MQPRLNLSFELYGPSYYVTSLSPALSIIAL
jgi:hypothetical protein